MVRVLLESRITAAVLAIIAGLFFSFWLINDQDTVILGPLAFPFVVAFTGAILRFIFKKISRSIWPKQKNVAGFVGDHNYDSENGWRKKVKHSKTNHIEKTIQEILSSKEASAASEQMKNAMSGKKKESKKEDIEDTNEGDIGIG